MFFAVPMEHILRGLFFDGSRFNSYSFYVHAFVMPLFVPSLSVHFTFGFRLKDLDGKDNWWSDDSMVVEKLKEAIQRDAIPFLEQSKSLSGAAATIASLGANNPHAFEASAYCNLLSGEDEVAMEFLEKIEMILDAKYAWRKELLDRAKTIKKLIMTNPGAAQQKLLDWETTTVRALGLCDFWSNGKYQV